MRTGEVYYCEVQYSVQPKKNYRISLLHKHNFTENMVIGGDIREYDLEKRIRSIHEIPKYKVLFDIKILRKTMLADPVNPVRLLSGIVRSVEELITIKEEQKNDREANTV